MITKNLIRAVLFALAISLSLPASAVSAAFAKNRAVQPNNSDLYGGERLRIWQYVPLNHSDAELRNLVNRTVRDVGSRSDRKVYIIWSDAKSQKLAQLVKKALRKKQLADKQLVVAKSQYRRDIYPLYIEIHGFDVTQRECRPAEAEIRFYSESQEFCAYKHNQRAQLRNPVMY